MLTLIFFDKCEDHPRYVEANAGCKHFDVHGGPDDIPISRNVFDAKVYNIGLTDSSAYYTPGPCTLCISPFMNLGL